VPEDLREYVAIHVLLRVAGVGGADDLRLLAGANQQRLVARGVAVGRQQYYAAVTEHVVVAVAHPIVERVVEVDRARAVARHEARPARRLELGPLHQEGGPREELVAAAVVEVQVRVRHEADVVRFEPQARELGHHVVAFPRLDRQALDPLGAQTCQRIDARLAMHTRVEQELAAWMAHQEARHRHGPGLARREVGHHAGAVELDVAGAKRIDVDHGHLGLVRPRSTSKNSGNVFDTHSGWAMAIPGARRPVTAKLIAIRWSSYVCTSHGRGWPG